jgi:putative copper resistance protein D
VEPQRREGAEAPGSAADRTGDAELEEYNARLAELAEKDARATLRAGAEDPRGR